MDRGAEVSLHSWGVVPEGSDLILLAWEPWKML